MAGKVGPNIVDDGLVICLNASDIKSFRGEPTTNLMRNSNDVSGIQYAPENEWSDTQVLRKTYNSTIITPVGMGATLIEESGIYGRSHLSRLGGGEESGLHSISCYVYPSSSGITDLVIGMLGDARNRVVFNMDAKTYTYGGGISNRNAFLYEVSGFPGWYRIGANIEGKVGGWVGSIGYSTSAFYTGSDGAKKMYICGIQYEYTSKPTHFIDAQLTRGGTVSTGGGLIDTTNNSNHGELINGITYNTSNYGNLQLDGSNDYINIPYSGSTSGSFTFTIVMKSNTMDSNPATNRQTIFGLSQNGNQAYKQFDLEIWGNSGAGFRGNGGDVENVNFFGYGWTSNGDANNINVYTVTLNSGSHSIYLNGDFRNTINNSLTASFNSITIGVRGSGGSFWNGLFYYFSMHNRILSPLEIKQNYNALKTRFNLS